MFNVLKGLYCFNIIYFLKRFQKVFIIYIGIIYIAFFTLSLTNKIESILILI